MTVFYGKLVYKLINKGSKSEQYAACLQMDDGQLYILRRHNSNLFFDSTLKVLTNKYVKCEGQARDGYLFFNLISEHF